MKTRFTYVAIRRSIGTLLLLGLLLGAGLLIPAQPVRAATSSVLVTAPLADNLYIVQRGDTLYRIARNYGTTVDAIMAANGLTSTTIYVGQRLYIPGATPPPAPYGWYQVQAGDTLYRIARYYGITVYALKHANGLTSDTIYVGQWLRINVSMPPPVLIRYQVRYGDTLSQIALNYGTTVWAIMSYNGLTSTHIYVGQWLTIAR